MTSKQSACRHAEFGGHIAVIRLVDTGHFLCEVTVQCKECDVPFSFLGPPLGLLSGAPSVSVDRTKLCIPIEPGPTALPIGGEMRFEVPQRVKES